MLRKSCFLIAFFFNLSSTLFCAGSLVTLSLERPGHKVYFTVEIARSPQELEQGLMHRKTLQKNSGMLFIFPHSKVATFWMKNTWLALDLIFIDEDFKIIQHHENAQPHTLDLIISSLPIKYVLELSAGSLQNHHIQNGDRLAF